MKKNLTPLVQFLFGIFVVVIVAAGINEVGFNTASGGPQRKFYVSIAGGNDSTGMRGRPDYPFQTLAAVQTNTVAGDTVEIGPGVYLGPTNVLYKTNVTFKLDPATRIGDGTTNIICLTNGTMIISGRGQLLGDIILTNSHLIAECGLFGINTSTRGIFVGTSSSQRSSMKIDCDVCYTLFDATTNLDFSVNCDLCAGSGQLFPGARLHGTINCRRFGMAGTVTDDANNDPLTQFVVNCAVADLDFNAGMQFAGAESYVIHSGIIKVTGALTGGSAPAFFVPSGTLISTFDTQHLKGSWNTNTTIALPNEPRTPYYDQIGF